MMLARRTLTSLAAATTTTALTVLHSSQFKNHVMPRTHPECVERTDPAAVEELRSKLPHVTFSEVDALHPEIEDALRRVHTEAYLASLGEPIPKNQIRALDEDTYLSTESFETTKLATSLWLSGVDHILQHNDVAFAYSRPPGHHAGAARACGFCTLNHAAVATAYALQKVDRVAVLDVDVHFGNGVASIFGNDPTTFSKDKARYVSIHQQPAFPYSGGLGAETLFARDNPGVLKFVPVLPETDGRTWLRKLNDEALPFLADFDPDLLILATGFDALDSDPLAQLLLTNADFHNAARAIRSTFPHLSILAGMEGGYDVINLPGAIASYLDGLLLSPPLETTAPSSPAASASVAR